MLIVSSFTDWLAIACMTLLIAIKALGPDFGWSIPALASGTIYAKMRGKVGGGSTTALLLFGAPWTAKALAAVVGRTVIGAALLLLVGCSSGLPPGAIKDARAVVDRGSAALDAGTTGLDRAGVEMQRLRTLLLAPCTEPTIGMTREQCDDAADTFNRARAEYVEIQRQLGEAVEVLRQVDVLLRYVEQAQ